MNTSPPLSRAIRGSTLGTKSVEKPMSHKCTFPGCNKAFNRKDHLKRHWVNHDENASVFRCNFPGCAMAFKRADVRNSHSKRHYAKLQKQTLKEDTPEVPPEWLGWLFSDQNNVMPLSVNGSPNSLLVELFQAEFGETTAIQPTTSASITPELIRMFLYLIPNLAQHPDFTTDRLEYCLQIYWAVFHIQYPILHKPSFSTSTEPPLLVLSMIVMGATFSVSVETTKLEDPQGIAMLIAQPLRWLIFQQRNSGPLELAALQSLLILEVFEKHYGTRELHERSSVHQAAKIEMMKRSPVLGGDPYAVESRANTTVLGTVPRSDTEMLWRRWIYAESLKRCALMGFCFDLTNCIVSSHSASLFVNKLRLELPCDDVLWESDYESFQNMPLPRKPELVLSSLKRLLMGQKVETSSFGKRVLLNAVFSIIIQFEQRDEAISLTSNINTAIYEQPWREKVAYALDAWKYLVDDGVCCDVNNLLVDVRARKTMILSPYFHLNDTSCKYPSYHMGHIRLYIDNFDMLIYAGAPLRMNVKTKYEDYNNVKQRMQQWAGSVNGKICVIHAYLCLYECLVGNGAIDYEPSTDPIPERSHIIIYCSLIVWCFSFIVRGPQQDATEDAYSYLTRVKYEFDKHLDYESAIAYYHGAKKCAEQLEAIDGLENLAGYTQTISDIYSRCTWALGQEYSRLMLHCRDRSLGDSKLFCDNMYK